MDGSEFSRKGGTNGFDSKDVSVVTIVDLLLLHNSMFIYIFKLEINARFLNRDN